MEDCFEDSNIKDNFAQLIQCLQTLTITKGNKTIEELAEKIQDQASFDDKLNTSLQTDTQYNWTKYPNFLSLRDVSEIWNKYDFVFPREKLYKVYSNTLFEHAKGLSKHLNKDEITKICDVKDSIFEFGATQKRQRFDTEERTLVYLDKKTINWSKSLERIENFAMNHRYSIKDVHELIYELASKFFPRMSLYFSELSLDSLSSILIAKDYPKHDLTVYLDPLMALERETHECLTSVMSQAIELYKKLEKLTNKTTDHTKDNFSEKLNQFAINSLSSFTSYELRTKLHQKIANNRAKGLTNHYEKLLASCVKAEKQFPECKPKEALKLNFRHNDPMSVNINSTSIRQLQKISFKDDIKSHGQLSSSSDDDEYIENDTKESVTKTPKKAIPKQKVASNFEQETIDAKAKQTEFCSNKENAEIFSNWQDWVIDFLLHNEHNPIKTTMDEMTKQLFKATGDNSELVKAILASSKISQWNEKHQYTKSSSIFETFLRSQSLRSVNKLYPNIEKEITLNNLNVKYNRFNRHDKYLYNRRASRDQSADKNRKYSPDADKNQYRHSRSRKKYKHYKHESGNRNKDRSYDRSRDNSHYRFRSRSQSYNKYRDRSQRHRYPNRSTSRSSSHHNTNRSRNYRYSRSRSNTPAHSRNSSKHRHNRSRSYNRSSTRSPNRHHYRNRSSSLRKIYTKFHPGYNCRSDYQIKNGKNCSKCLIKGHYEFECPNYLIYAGTPCPKCKQGNHTPQDCDKQFNLN